MGKIKMIIWDCDGTLTTINSAWQWVHEKLGTWKNCGEKHLKDFLEGKISYEVFALYDALEWKGTTETKLLQILSTIPLRDGVDRTLNEFKEKGLIQILVSSGLSHLTSILSSSFDVFSKIYANELEIVDGKITGRVTINVPWGGKGTLARAICTDLNIPSDNVLSVGDSSSDLEIFEYTKYSIAVDAPQEIAKSTTWAVKTIGEIPNIIEPYLS